ncbi:MAG TPA: flippase-like domain-containing protein [Pseudolabrys sp.]|nr:flippase-like domain-containing protein [Pseudolabrys sp.]
MKRLSILTLIVGIGVVAVAVLAANAQAVGAAFARAGSAAILVIVLRYLAVALAGVAWWFLFPSRQRPRLGLLVTLRFVRDGTNSLLPLAQIGGDFIGARMLTFWGVAAAMAGATVLIDILVQVVSQVVFTLAGFAVLAVRGGAGAVAFDVALGLTLAIPALAGFYVAQRHWGHKLLTIMVQRFAGAHETALYNVDTLYRQLEALYRRRAGVAKNFAIHLVEWIFNAAEVWVALSAMGYDIGYLNAFAIDSLSQALSSAAFLVPGAVGVQEGGLVLLCALYGVPAPAALALSLIKRTADLGVGIPGLIFWQGRELRQWWRGKRPESGGHCGAEANARRTR